MNNVMDNWRSALCDFSARRPTRENKTLLARYAVSRFVAGVILEVILLSAITSSSALAWQDEPGGWFENPPLRYEGPDPTSHYYLPQRVAFNHQEEIGGGWTTQGNEPLPPLVAPNQELPMIPGFGDEPFLEQGFVGGGVTEHKDGFFQKLGATETWIDRDGLGDFGLHEIDVFVAVAVPAPTREWPMLITATFNPRLIDGPVAPDLPGQIYESYVDFLWVPRLSPRWTAIVGVAPSYYGDFEADAENAFRLTGKGLARYDWSPNLQVLFGVLYLNRNDIRLLPAGGIIWTPNDAKRYELIFPKPKLAHRITLGEHYEDWIYLGGEFGGNTYAVERAAGFEDYITLRDIRAYFGIERKMNGGAGYRLEAGYVFARRVEFDSGTPELEVDDAVMLRGGFTF